ncbi:hypothetical protein DYB38_002449, partial [Aphanomyces astaci]
MNGKPLGPHPLNKDQVTHLKLQLLKLVEDDAAPECVMDILELLLSVELPVPVLLDTRLDRQLRLVAKAHQHNKDVVRLASKLSEVIQATTDVYYQASSCQVEFSLDQVETLERAYITIYLGLRDVPILRLRELMANVDLADDARLGAAMSLLLLGDHQSLFDLLSNDSAKCDQYRRYKQLAKDNTLLSNRFKTGMRMLLSSIARSRTQEHVVATCMDVMAHMIVVDMKTNEAAYELVLHPFKLVPNQPHVVMTWLKVLVDRLGALVDSHMPPKGSLCWRNLDNICSIATSVVLHFDPWASVTTTACGRESLVDEDDGRTAAAVFWKAKDEYAKERELSDAILNVWHKCASSLSCDVDASFGRTAQPRLSLSSSQVPVATRSSPSTGAAAKRNSIKDQSQPPTIAPSSLRQFPGGAMRQILALILRSMYMAIKDQDMFLHSHGEYNEEDEEDEDEDESPAPRRRSRVNSTVALDAVFAAKLAKLDYFVELLQLNQQNYVPAKEDASLVHWLALELRHLMEEAGRL